MPLRYWREPLDADKVETPKADIYIIENRSKGCGFCIESCPRDVLEESDEINERGVHPPRVVDKGKCVLCHFCSAVCPDFAIYAVDKTDKSRRDDAKEA